MKRLEELLLFGSGIAFGAGGVLYWLVLAEDMSEFQSPAILAGLIAVLSGLILGLRRRKVHG